MLKRIIALFLASQVSLAGLPPTTLKGQSEANKVTTFNFQVPNNQATTTGGGTRLIETGNPNLLTNASFENSTVSTGWTVTTGTASADTVRVDGSQSLAVAYSSASGDLLSQSVTPASPLTGLNVVASVFVKNADSNMSLCMLNAGSEVYCEALSTSSDWQYKQVPFPAPSSGSIGLKIKTSASTTKTVNYDAAQIQALESPASNINPALEFANFYASATWSSTATTNIKIPLDTTSDSTNYPLSSNCATVKSTGTTPYELVVSVQAFGNNEATNVGYNVNGGSVNLSPNFTVSTNASGEFYSYQWRWTPNLSGGDVICAYSRSASTRTYSNGTLILRQLKSYPQAAAPASQTDYGWTSYTPTFTGFGSPTGISCYHKRSAENLFVRCKHTNTTTTATEARVSLPNNLVSSSTYSTLEYAGLGPVIRSETTSATPIPLIEPSVSYLTFGTVNGTSTQLQKRNGNDFGSSTTWSWEAKVRIQGWDENQRAPTLIGSVTSNSGNALKIETADVSSGGVVSNESSDWINGNCSTASTQFTCSFNSGTFSSLLWCGPMKTDTGNTDVTSVTSRSSSQVVYNFRREAVGQVLLNNFIMCIGLR